MLPTQSSQEDDDELDIDDEYERSEEEEDSDYELNDIDMAKFKLLPENVRHALEIRKSKTKHSEFYYTLRSLNDKIDLYTQLFYTR